jgi:gliding motility-associated-like protein
VTFKSLFKNYLLFLLLGSVLLFVSTSTVAQLCTGSLGDPVVNINFGTGSSSYSFTAPGYRLTTNSCPNDGEYSITTYQSSCGRQWHSVSADHTGGGAFMMVNASNNPGDFFVQTVSNLCPNTTYEFSAWVLNVVNNSGLIKPNLSFKVETVGGVILNQYATGDIGVAPQATWEQVGFFFTTGSGNTSVVLRITNNSPGGNGNDLALDDITFRPCGPAIRSIASSGFDTARFCEDQQQPIRYLATVSSGFASPVYQWQLSVDTGRNWVDITGANGLQLNRSNSTPGYYAYRLTVAEAGSMSITTCRIASNVHIAAVHPKPIINAGPDRTILGGRSIQIRATSDGVVGNLYQWVPSLYLSDATLLNPVASPPLTQTYTVQVTSTNNCINSDQVVVSVIEKLYVPTAFTPNGDGKNDQWIIPNLDLSDGTQVHVFDRSGSMVFNAYGSAVNWDGTYKGVPVQTGVLIFVIKYPDGFIQKGKLTLIR